MRAHRRRLRRAFTLVEVLVALSAGVLVSMAAFTLSKNATAYFQHEARIASAQLALTLAMNRLTGDIQRASLLSTPNIAKDPTVCNGAGWPVGLSLLSGITITPGVATPQGSLQNPPETPQSSSWEPQTPPDKIVIGGSMDSSEVYQVQSIIPGAGGAPLLVMRNPANEPATYRAQASLGPGETLTCKLMPSFAPNLYTGTTIPACPALIPSGRFGHIYQPSTNFHWFGVISTVTLDPVTGAINVQLATTPAIPVKPASTCGIGLGDTGQGWLFSVVSRVQYDIESLVNASGVYIGNNPAYSGMLATPAGAQAQLKVTGDGGRTELVRTELDANNQPVANSAELVAEYAVDLRFGVTVSSLITGYNYNPTVTSYPLDDQQVYIAAAPVSATGGGTPQLIRAVQVRLAIRSRAPDRDADLPMGPDGRRLHFLVDPTLQPSYARVRTNYANVALPNQGGFSLW